MKLSVAMSTYNGALYLADQLASIASQTRLPDEMIVCDDCSTDETRAIIEAFALATPIPVHLHVNEWNLGSTRTFERAISQCTGDIIALCDQDDVWRKDKLQLIERSFFNAPRAGLVFSDAEIVDENLKPLGRRMWAERGLTDKRRKLIGNGRPLDVLVPGWTVTGATMAFRSNYKQLFLPIPADIPMLHDGWIALVIAAASEVTLLDEPLVKYRQHGGQQVGARYTGSEEQQRSSRQTIDAALRRSNSNADLRTILRLLRERLVSREDLFDCRNTFSSIEHYARHIDVRDGLPSGKLRRVPAILQELITWRYHRYSKGFLSAAKDLVT